MVPESKNDFRAGAAGWGSTTLALAMEPYPRSIRTPSALLLATVATDRECAFVIASAGGIAMLMQEIPVLFSSLSHPPAITFQPPPPPPPSSLSLAPIPPSSLSFSPPAPPPVSSSELLAAFLLAIANCSSVYKNKIEILQHPSFHVLCSFLTSEDSTMQQHAALAISQCAQEFQTRIQLQRLGVVSTFVQLLENSKIVFVQRSAAFALAACALDHASGETLVKIGLNALNVGLGPTSDPTVVSFSALTLSRLAHHKSPGATWEKETKAILAILQGDRDREREREKERERERDREKEKEKENNKERERERDREKEREKDKGEREKEKERDREMKQKAIPNLLLALANLIRHCPVSCNIVGQTGLEVVVEFMRRKEPRENIDYYESARYGSTGSARSTKSTGIDTQEEGQWNAMWHDVWGDVQEKAALVLAYCCQDHRNKSELLKLGAIHCLVRALQSPFEYPLLKPPLSSLSLSSLSRQHRRQSISPLHAGHARRRSVVNAEISNPSSDENQPTSVTSDKKTNSGLTVVEENEEEKVGEETETNEELKNSTQTRPKSAIQRATPNPPLNSSLPPSQTPLSSSSSPLPPPTQTTTPAQTTTTTTPAQAQTTSVNVPAIQNQPAIKLTDSHTRRETIRNVVLALAHCAEDANNRKVIIHTGGFSALLNLLEQLLARARENGEFEKDLEKEICEKTLQAISSCVNDPLGFKEIQQLGGLDNLVKSLQLKSLLAVRFSLWTLATCAGDSACAQAICNNGGFEKVNVLKQALPLLPNSPSRLPPIVSPPLQHIAQHTLNRLLNNNLTAKYWFSGILESTEKTNDGFYDFGRAKRFASLAELQAVSVNPHTEVLLADTSSDTKLATHIKNIASGTAHATTLRLKVELLANYVNDVMGGPQDFDKYDNFSYDKDLFVIKHNLQSNVIPIGLYTKGVCRHRAFLFKVIADRVGIPASLFRSRYFGRSHAWNTVVIDGTTMIVDLMHSPGGLYSESSPRATQYIRKPVNSTNSVLQ